MSEYTTKIDRLFAFATTLGFTEQDFADLAIAAADQSGATKDEQDRIASILCPPAYRDDPPTEPYDIETLGVSGVGTEPDR